MVHLRGTGWRVALLALMLTALGCGDDDLPPALITTGAGGRGDEPALPSGEGEVCGNESDDDGDREPDCSDPDCLAVAANATQPTGFVNTVSWLYAPSNGAECEPLQQGVAPGALIDSRVAVVRGRVSDAVGQPLAGAEIQVVGAPELGRARSRGDGWFDIAVNGGTKVTLQIGAAGLLSVHRRASVPSNSFAQVEPVVLVPRSDLVTRVSANGTAPLQLARAEAREDGDGRREPIVMFPSGVRATAEGADGSEQALDSLSVRLTEFTVGDLGPSAMPADLPVSSGYTYAFDLSVDEAEAMGAAGVRFDTALPLYVENFLGFPAGTPVPVGYYDPEATLWQPEGDGLVIALVGEAGGLADIDIDGDGAAEGADALEAAGFVAGEREQLAQLYQPGQTLWRVQLSHFSRFDLNWGFGFPGDASEPPDPELAAALTDTPGCETGSVLRVDNQSSPASSTHAGA